MATGQLRFFCDVFLSSAALTDFLANWRCEHRVFVRIRTGDAAIAFCGSPGVLGLLYTDNILRGRHAHHATEHILLAVAGRIVVNIERADGTLKVFQLESPHVGLYVPPNVWHTMQYSPGAVQLALASQPFAEEDYIRDYQEFKKVWGAAAT